MKIVAAAALAQSLAASGSARALAATQGAEGAGRFQISLPVVFMDRQIGYVDAELDEVEAVRIDRRQTAALLADRLPPGARDKLLASEASDPFVSMDALSRMDIKARFDAAALKLFIDIALDRQGSQDVRIIDDAANSLRGQYLSPAPLSASLTLTAAQDVNWTDFSPRAQPVTLLAQLSANIGGIDGVSLFAEVLRDSSGKRLFERTSTALVHDNAATAVRFVAGDQHIPVAGFQVSQAIGGFSVARSFSDLQPFRNIRPAGQFGFRLDRATRVDIRVNGNSIRQLRLEPGQYNLQEFPFLTGVNEVQVYALDSFNQELIADFSQFFNAQLLRPGLSEFGMSVGFPQQRLPGGGLRYDTNDAVATGFFRQGLNETLTLGANGQGNRSGGMVGVEGIWASPLGSVLASLALSRNRRAGEGAQILVGYDINILSLGAVRNLRANLEYRRVTPGFRAVGPAFLSDVPNVYRAELRGSFSTNLPGNTYLSVAASHLWRRDRRRAEHRIGVNAGKTIAGFNLNVSVERARIDRLGDETRVGITLLRTLGERSTARASYNSQRNAFQLQYARSEAPEVDEFGGEVQLERSDFQTGINGNIRYNGNRVRVLARHNTARPSRDGAPLLQQSSYAVSTQLAFDGTSLAIGRPVGRSFAIVAADPALAGRPVSVGQGFGRAKPQARSGRLGPALVGVGSIYAPQVLNIDVPDLPIGFDIGQARYDLFPGLATGYRIKVGSDASRIVVGQVVNASGEAVKLQVGKFFEKGQAPEAGRTFFTDQSGRFTLDGVRPGVYQALLGTTVRYRLQIEVGETSVGLVDLGEVSAAGEAGQ